MVNTDFQAVPDKRRQSKASMRTYMALIAVMSIALFVFIGATLGPAFSESLSGAAHLSGSSLSGSYASYGLKQSVWAVISGYEQALGCDTPTALGVSILQPVDGNGAWTESWAVEACGSHHAFTVHFTPDANTVIQFAISH